MTPVDLTVGSANLAKELSSADFLLDVESVRDVADVVGFQEIRTDLDDGRNRHVEIDSGMPAPTWSHAGRDGECPILVKTSKFRFVPAEKLPAGFTKNHGTIQISKGRVNVTPWLPLTWGIYYSVESPDLPPIVFANTHYVPGAWSTPGQIGDDDGWRRSTWQLEFSATRLELQKFRDAGLTVILVGDFNRGEDMPLFWPDQTGVVGGNSIDKIVIIPAEGGTQISILGTNQLSLKSDHDLRLANLRLDYADNN